LLHKNGLKLLRNQFWLYITWKNEQKMSSNKSYGDFQQLLRQNQLQRDVHGAKNISTTFQYLDIFIHFCSWVWFWFRQLCWQIWYLPTLRDQVFPKNFVIWTTLIQFLLCTLYSLYYTLLLNFYYESVPAVSRYNSIFVLS
jgi:hypothetical protein